MRIAGIRGTKVLLVSEPSFDSGEIRDFIRTQRKHGSNANLMLYRFHRTDGRCTFYAAEPFDHLNPRHVALEEMADEQEVDLDGDRKRISGPFFKRCYSNTLTKVD